jgi:hypothetical protein
MAGHPAAEVSTAEDEQHVDVAGLRREQAQQRHLFATCIAHGDRCRYDAAFAEGLRWRGQRRRAQQRIEDQAAAAGRI